jgi:bacterioferritin
VAQYQRPGRIVMAQSDSGRSIELTPTVLIDDVAALTDRLNDDLAGELQTIIMYLQYSALLRGLHRRELRALFQAEIPDEQRHARFLADKIAALGGIPVTVPKPIPRAVSPFQMLRNIRDVENRSIVDYSERVAEAGIYGDLGLKSELERIISDETRHKEEVDQILAGWNQPGTGLHFA